MAERATQRRLVNSDNAIICLCDILPKYHLTVRLSLKERRWCSNKVKSKQFDRRRSVNGNLNLKHMANMIADPANVDDGKRPHVAAMLNLNSRHTAGTVT